MSPRPPIDHIRKPQILRAAAEVITERGLTGTRIADVAERAGTSAPAVLYWFESREQLLTEALIADEHEFGEALDLRLDSLTDARARLLAILEATVSDGDLSLWMELWARSLHDEGARAERRRLDVAWRMRIAAVIAAGQLAGEFDAALDADDFAIKLAALIDGLSVQVTLGDPDVTAERMLAICVEFAELETGALLSLQAQETA
jgi:AcrR family transcriptional regulator